MKKRIVSLVVVLVMLFSMLGITASAASTGHKDDLLPIEVFVMNQVEVFSAIDDNWDETTEITSYRTLYSPDNTINGYIFLFKTGNRAAGFMQIGVQGEDLYVVNLGFDGDDILTKMVEQHNLSVSGRVTASTDEAIVPEVSLNGASRVYYTGGFNYYIYSGENKLVSLWEGDVIETGLTALAGEYTEYQEGRTMKLSESVPETSMSETTNSSSFENYTVNSFYNASTYMKTMSYWSTYNNHCTPTAATNMVMYWKHGRGFFANHTASLSQTNVFTWFYQAMQTNLSSSGTEWNNIWPAYATYFTNYSGASTAVSDRVTLVTFNKIRTKMDADIPVHLEVISYAGLGNHSVNVWGYAVNGSSKYLRITDNWGTTFGNILISYSEYSYGQYVYYGLSS